MASVYPFSCAGQLKQSAIPALSHEIALHPGDCLYSRNDLLLRYTRKHLTDTYPAFLIVSFAEIFAFFCDDNPLFPLVVRV